MKKIKKLLAMIMAMTMVLGMSLTSFAAEDTATITIDNAGPDALFNEVQIVVANPETETGWDIVDEYFDEFSDAFGTGADEQEILKGMIFEATNGTAGTEIESFDSKYAAALDEICAQITAPAPADPEEGTEEVGERSPLEVDAAGVYVIRGFEEGYVYGTMSAYVSFGPYDTESGLPTGLEDTTVEAKRVPTETGKSSDDEDKVVEIGREVTYTITSTVPYINPLELATAKYWLTDKLSGADFVLNASGKVEVNVTTTSGFNNTYEVVPTPGSGQDEGKSILSVDLSEILVNNDYANDTITITYQAKVTDTIVGNEASTGKSENGADFGTGSESLFTGQVTMTKYAEDTTTTLSGAGFEVRKVAAGFPGSDENPALRFDKVEDGVYMYNPDGTVTEVFTGKDGTVVLKGLDLGGYEFKETTAPKGYSINQETRVAVVALAEFVEVADSVDDIVNGATSITDTKLASLPSTGGIGTTIFTIGGCAIMIAATALYFVNRRKSEEN